MGQTGQPWFCYIVRCRDGALYVGIATDLEERVREHNWGVAASFTAKRRPVSLAWFEAFESQEPARRREVAVKKWSRTKKLQLVTAFQTRIQENAGRAMAKAAQA